MRGGLTRARGKASGEWRPWYLRARSALGGIAGAAGRLASARAAVLVKALLWSAAPAMPCAGRCSPGVPGLLCQTAPAS